VSVTSKVANYLRCFVRYVARLLRWRRYDRRAMSFLAIFLFLLLSGTRWTHYFEWLRIFENKIPFQSSSPYKNHTFSGS